MCIQIAFRSLFCTQWLTGFDGLGVLDFDCGVLNRFLDETKRKCVDK